MTTITLPAQTLRTALASALPCASKDRTLPILNAVRLVVEVGEFKAMSTDRFSISRYSAIEHVKAEGEGAITLAVADTKALIAAIPKPNRINRADEVSLTIEDGKLTVALIGATLTYTGVDGDYPAIERLIPDGDDNTIGRVGLNHSTLKQMTDCVKALDARNSALVFTPGESNTKPIRLTVEDAPEWTGLIMPMRIVA